MLAFFPTKTTFTPWAKAKTTFANDRAVSPWEVAPSTIPFLAAASTDQHAAPLKIWHDHVHTGQKAKQKACQRFILTWTRSKNLLEGFLHSSTSVYCNFCTVRLSFQLHHIPLTAGRKTHMKYEVSWILSTYVHHFFLQDTTRASWQYVTGGKVRHSKLLKAFHLEAPEMMIWRLDCEGGWVVVNYHLHTWTHIFHVYIYKYKCQ